MRALKIARDYLCYCGIDKNEYHAVKKDAYISNYKVWRILQVFMVAVFAVLLVSSFFSELMRSNRLFYSYMFLYSAISTCFFFMLKKDSILAQLLIYLSISVLFLFACYISQNKPELPATTFIVFLLITPLFMIDKPYFMALELCAASAVFLIWMHQVKPYEIWQYDAANAITYTVVGIFLHIIANSLRIREFVLTRAINIQKDRDELTGLKNKDALTREINAYLEDEGTGEGLMFILDVDRFKSINDTWGHDVGDSVIRQLGVFLGGKFTGDEIVGRFGGDEFILFVKGTSSPETARGIANDLIAGVSDHVKLPEKGRRIRISIGAAMYHGLEKHYSEIFKKADMAMYRAKADPVNSFCIYE